MSNKLVESFILLFDRDLKKLEDEIDLYENDVDLWKLQGQISNSAGNLALHLCGNLRHFIGAVLGKDGYVRNRQHEFSARNIRKEGLINEIIICKLAVHHALLKLNDEDLLHSYPIEVFSYPMTNYYFLNHLFGHLGYHLGQINYHRRLLTASKS